MIKKKLICIYEMLYAWKVRFQREAYYKKNVKKYHLRVMGSKETIDYIKKNKCSIARFGDGEFDMISGIRDLKFQKHSEKLGQDLLGVLKNKNKSLLICIPLSFTTIKGSNWHAAMYWKRWGIEEGNLQPIVDLIKDTCGIEYLFGNAQITRPYIDWETSKNAKKVFPLLQSLWEKRNILIVEGSQTRLGIGNDLFDNASRIRRILCPAVGAYDCYDKILKKIEDEYEENELVILALGPTATVLAADLSNRNIQAFDLGHIDIEYEWFRLGVKSKVKIPGKFVNEVLDGQEPNECTDENYLGQIIAKIENKI